MTQINARLLFQPPGTADISAPSRRNMFEDRADRRDGSISNIAPRKIGIRKVIEQKRRKRVSKVFNLSPPVSLDWRQREPWNNWPPHGFLARSSSSWAQMRII